MATRRLAAFTVLAAGLAPRIAAQPPEQRVEVTGSTIQDFRYPLAASSLLEKIERVLLSLNPPQRVESSREGKLETSWFAVPGRRVGVFWWQRELATEARFVIVITPLFSDPVGSSRYEMWHEVRERASESYDWEVVDPNRNNSLPADAVLEPTYDRLYRALQQWKKR
jgi:hypothetical protein